MYQASLFNFINSCFIIHFSAAKKSADIPPPNATSTARIKARIIVVSSGTVWVSIKGLE